MVHEECLATLQEELPADYPVYWHCFLLYINFQGRSYLQRTVPGMDLQISKSLLWNYSKVIQQNYGDKVPAIQAVPLKCILIWTDAPLQVPTKYKAKAEKMFPIKSTEYKHNHSDNPFMVHDVACFLSSIHLVPELAVCQVILENTQRFFRF